MQRLLAWGNSPRRCPALVRPGTPVEAVTSSLLGMSQEPLFLTLTVAACLRE